MIPEAITNNSADHNKLSDNSARYLIANMNFVIIAGNNSN